MSRPPYSDIFNYGPTPCYYLSVLMRHVVIFRNIPFVNHLEVFIACSTCRI